MYFCNFVIISPWKRARNFIWTNLHLLHPRMLCANFGWICPSGSGETVFVKFVNVFSQFCYYLPLEKGRALHSNKLEFPTHRNALRQVWLNLAQWFWRRRFSKSVHVFLQFCNFLPLKKGGALNLNKLESSTLKDALCQVWLKFTQWFWRRRWKCEKFTTTTTTTDNGQILI